jgi:hypothetical protein
METLFCWQKSILPGFGGAGDGTRRGEIGHETVREGADWRLIGA